MNAGAVQRFHESQQRLLEQTYDLAWQQGVGSYEPDEAPRTPAQPAAPGVLAEARARKYRAPTGPDVEARARALAPAIGGLQAMTAELLALTPTGDHNDQASAAARAGEIAPEEAEAHAERLAVNDWIDSNAWRLDAGESVAWAGEQRGFAEAADADGQLVEWLTEADGHVCEDCEALGDLPPMPLQDWPATPGSGDTVCNVGCRCVLQVADDQTVGPNGEPPGLSAEQEGFISGIATRRADAETAARLSGRTSTIAPR